MTTFIDLQDGWYNGMIQGLGQSDDSFQLTQPSPPIAAGDGANTLYWAYYNQIPPYSLTQVISSGGNQFYSDYRALLSALMPSRVVDVQKDVDAAAGAGTFAKWQAYASGLSPIPTMNQIPTMFMSWAMLNAPSAASIGSSDYSAIILDPIASAQNALTLLYTTPNGQPKPFDWSIDYNAMVHQLASAPQRSFSFDSSTMNSNVSSSWTSGGNSGFFGLWGGSSSESSISKKFAASRVTVKASFDHVMGLGPSPGNWYSSGAMGLAYANKTGNPWSPQSSITWDNTFGSNGNMQRFMANVIICSGMVATITSSAQYNESEQTSIHNSGHAGFWPFYCSSGGSSSTNSSSFSESGQLTITTSSKKDVPVVLGGSVLPAAKFVGHSVASASFAYKLAADFARAQG